MAASVTAILALCVRRLLVSSPRRRNSRQRTRSFWAEFENKTGDPVFDQTLRQGLAVQLEQSPFLTLVSDQSIAQTLHLMNRPLGTPLTPEVAREICQRTGSAAVLEGSITSAGKPVRLVAACQELPHRRCPRTGAGDWQEEKKKS